MQIPAGMKALVLACSVVTASVAPAAAGTYLGLGIGTAPSLGESMQTLEPASRSARLTLGQRLGPLSLEGGAGGYELASATSAQARSVSASAGGKLSFVLQGQLEAFVRGGVERTWLSGDAMSTLSGDGVYYGGGAELRLALPLGSTSLWVDYSRHQATLRNERTELDASAGVWTVGLSVGL